MTYRIVEILKGGRCGFTNAQIAGIAKDVIDFVNNNNVNLYLKDPNVKKYLDWRNGKRVRPPIGYEKFEAIQAEDTIKINVDSFHMWFWATAYTINRILKKLGIKVAEI